MCMEELEHRLRLRGESPFYDAFWAKDDVDVDRPNMALVDGELPSAPLVIWRYRNRDLPRLRQWKALLENYHQVREQVFGDAYDPRGHDHIVKHDVALDRKLERTLSMLLKLQEIRRNRPEAS